MSATDGQVGMPAERVVLAIDPGSAKCGIAVVRSDGEVLYRAIFPLEQTVSEVETLLPSYSPEAILIGNGTGSASLQSRIKSAFPAVPLLPVKESHTSEMARVRYLAANPPKGLHRLLPAALRTPDKPYDDYVAIILAEQYWQKSAGSM